MDRIEFAEAFTLLISAFPNKEIPKSTAEAYYVMLQDLPEDVMKAASALCLARYDWFPTIRQLRDAAGEYYGNLKDLPEPVEAWESVMQAIRDGAGHPIAGDSADVHPLIEKSVQAIGGWRTIGQSDVSFPLQGRNCNRPQQAHFWRG
jgi:hypothetical protein